MRWMRNTEGKCDAVLTMAWIGFVVVVLKILLAGTKLSISGNSLSLGEIDSGIVAALLTPTLGAYVARRYTDKRHKSDVTKTEQKILSSENIDTTQ